MAAALTCAFAMAPEGSLALRLLAWGVLAALALQDMRICILLACFFASFFKAFGALEPGLFVRPVHLITLCLFVLVAKDLRENLVDQEVAKALAWCCAPLALIALFTYLTGATQRDAAFAIKGVVKFFFDISLFLLLAFSVRKRPLLHWGLAGFFVGVFLRAWLALASFAVRGAVFGESLRLNHAFGFLCGAAGIFMFVEMMNRRHVLMSLLQVAGTLLVLSAGALTLSRSTWAASLAGFAASSGVIFLGLKGKVRMQRRCLGWVALLITAGAALVLWGLRADVEFRSRVLELRVLIQPASLYNTFIADEQGGFLGARVRQFSEAMDIVRVSPLLGVGFNHDVMAFRSLYLMILAGSGVVGFLAFLLFAAVTLQLLYDAAKRSRDRELSVVAIGVIGSMMGWLVCSLAENLFFEVWVWALMALGVGCVFSAFLPGELWHLVKQRSKVWVIRLALCAAFILTLDPGMRWSWRICGWLLLAGLILLEPPIGLRSLFFLSPFFVTYGVFQVPLGAVPFHVKPLHVAYLLTVAAVFLRRGSLAVSIRSERIFFPLGFFAFWALLTALWSPEPVKVLRTSLNFTALLVIFGTAFAWIRDWRMFRSCLDAFLCGVLVRLVVLLLNQLLRTSFFTELLAHNHHAALMAVLGGGVAGSLFAWERESSWRRAFYVFVFFMSALAIVLSLARAAWLSAGFGFVFFYVGALLYARSKREGVGGLAWLPLVLGLFFLWLRVFYWRPEIAARLRGILSLFDLDFLRDCIRDRAVGAHVFGVRINQILDVWRVFRENWLFGTGFTVRTLGYHGLGYTVLTSCGVVGSALAGWFVWRWLSSAWHAVRLVKAPTKGFLGLGLVSCFLAWLLYTFSETLFLQFDIWVVLTSGAVYAKLVLLEAQSSGPRSPIHPVWAHETETRPDLLRDKA